MHLVYLILGLLLFSANQQSYACTVTPFTTQSLCAASFPTSYVSGSFAITEVNKSEFGKNQRSKTILFDAPTGFAFNTTAGTYSVTCSGTRDVSSISITSITTSRITVTISTSSSAAETNTMTVNCQIRATAETSSTGKIKRNGGTFKIGKSTAKPSSTQSLGDCSATLGMSYSSSTVAQPNTGTVSQGTTDNDILQIQVVSAGSCSAVSVTQFNFNTTGCTSASADISNAKVYYTGTSSTFSPVNLFGTYSAPNGNFNITGSRTLSTGTNYFWLVYDVTSSALASHTLDAQCTSVTLSGSIGAKTPSVTNPAGSRTTATLTQYYSRGTGNWNDNTNWSNTSGGASCNCQPNGTGNVYISAGHTVTLNANRTVNFVTINDGGRLQDDGSSTLTVSNNLNTVSTGRFTSTSIWSVTGNLNLSGTGANTTTKNFTVNGMTTIGSGTSLTENGTSGNDIYLKGNIELDGTLSSGSNGGTIILNGGSTQNIFSSSGGTINGSGAVICSISSKNINANTTLTINPVFSILGSITINNYGNVTLGSNLTGSVSGSTWENDNNSTLSIAGTLLSSGTMEMTSHGNTVNYNSNSAQTIKCGTYYNLTVSNGGTRTFATSGTISVTNMLRIQDAAILDASTNTLSGAGGLTMTGTSEFKIAKTTSGSATVPELTGTYDLSGGTITFNQSGATTQALNGNPGYYNVKLSGGNASSVFDLSNVADISNNLEIISAGKMTANAELTVAGNFTHNSTGSSQLSNNMNVTGSCIMNAGSFDLRGYYLTAGNMLFNGGNITSTVANDTIEVNDGDWTFDAGTFTNTNVCVKFTSESNQKIKGARLCAFNGIYIDKGSDTTSELEASSTGNGMSMSGTLTMINGLFKLSHPSASAQFGGSITIPSTCGIHINGGTLNGSNGTVTCNGLFRITSGTATPCSNADNAFTCNSSGKFENRGGTCNFSGRFYNNGGTANFIGGTTNVCTQGLSSSTNASFEHTTSSLLNISGDALIAFQKANSSTGGDIKIIGGGTKSITGGTFQIGNSSTPSGQIFNINSAIHINDLSVHSGNSCTVRVSGNPLISEGDINISTGCTFDLSTSNLDVYLKGDWINDGVFVPGTGTVTFDGFEAQKIKGSNYTTFNNLRINNSCSSLSTATLTLEIPCSINGQLTLSRGYIVTNSINILNMAAGSSTSGCNANSYVNGPMTKTGTTAFTFPIGTGNGTKWARVGIGSCSSLSTFKAQYFDHAYSNAYSMATTPSSALTRVSQLEYWQLDRTSGVGNSTVTLFWEDAAWSVIKDLYAGLRIARFNGSAWESSCNAITTTGSAYGHVNGTVTTNTALTEFGPITFGLLNKFNPLPVELISFTAQQLDENTAELKWTTASELNNDHFDIERSLDSKTWQKIDEAAGHGTTLVQQNYNYQDNSIASLSVPVVYYRLRQVDFNGAFEYSPIRFINLTNSVEKNTVKSWYNSESNQAEVVIGLVSESDCNLRLMDANGKIITKKNITGNAGNNLVTFDMTSMQPGIYIISTNSGITTTSNKIVKH